LEEGGRDVRRGCGAPQPRASAAALPHPPRRRPWCVPLGAAPACLLGACAAFVRAASSPTIGKPSWGSLCLGMHACHPGPRPQPGQAGRLLEAANCRACGPASRRRTRACSHPRAERALRIEGPASPLAPLRRLLHTIASTRSRGVVVPTPGLTGQPPPPCVAHVAQAGAPAVGKGRARARGKAAAACLPAFAAVPPWPTGLYCKICTARRTIHGVICSIESTRWLPVCLRRAVGVRCRRPAGSAERGGACGSGRSCACGSRDAGRTGAR
jgi:hypothetical protein